uniref:SFRICE_032523 n=1 Tax=Spodoptera frugiperda TaxID=7108 RepID=A0A2H1WP83_SPOFR
MKLRNTHVGIQMLRECSSCNDDDLGVTRWTMPLLKSGEKKYYLGIFFKHKAFELGIKYALSVFKPT